MKKFEGFGAILAVFAVLAVCGCGDDKAGAEVNGGKNAAAPEEVIQQDKQNQAQNQQNRVDSVVSGKDSVNPVKSVTESAPLPKSPVVKARVDDAVLTDADVKEAIRLRIALSKIRSKRFKERDAARIAKQLSSTAARHFVDQELILKYGRVAGIAPTAEEREAFLANMARQYRVKTIADLREKLPEDLRGQFDRELERDLSVAIIGRKMREATPHNVTDEELDTAFANIAKMNAAAQAAQDAIYAKATNVWQKLERGDISFAEAVEDYSEADETEDEGEWNTFTIDELRNLETEKELIRRLPKMAAGDVTPPIESDEGLAIVKLAAKGDYSRRGGAKEASYRLNRIFFRLPEFAEEIDREEARKLIGEAKIDKAVRAKMQRIMDATRIEGVKLEKAK